MEYKYLFGPVPSRRLGISLGVDLVDYKTCSMDCIYCEVGKTTNLTTDRKEYIEVNEVIKELNHYLGTNPNLDYITFSGQGEPTLNSKFNLVVNFVKNHYPEYKLATITNSSLILEEDVIKALSRCDVILPSLDSATNKGFDKINKPCENLNIKRIIDGLADFNKHYNTKLWLEIFIIPGMNDTKEELSALREALIKINPALVQLNSLDRPGRVDFIEKVNLKRMNEIKNYFKSFNIKIISKYKNRKKINSYDGNIADKIVNLLKRRPCTLSDLETVLGIHRNELNKYLSMLEQDNKITKIQKDRGFFYKIHN